jgi:hypothetical protein
MPELPPTPFFVENGVANIDAGNPLPPGRKLPTRLLCERFNVCDRTIARWQLDPKLGFPSPILINGRKYFDENKIAQWEREQASKS